MIILIISALLILCETVFGGVDFSGRSRAMTSEEYYANYNIPEFENKEQAEIWAYKHHNEEPMRRLLKKRMKELLVIVSPYAGSLEPGHLKIVIYYMSQWEDCEKALKILNEYHAIYKATEGKVDWAMKAKEENDLSIPHFKSINEAQKWANSKNFDPELFRRLKNKMMNIEISTLQNYRASDKQSMRRMNKLIDQYEMVSLAVLIFRGHRSHGKIGNNPVGSSVAIMSSPLTPSELKMWRAR